MNLKTLKNEKIVVLWKVASYNCVNIIYLATHPTEIQRMLPAVRNFCCAWNRSRLTINSIQWIPKSYFLSGNQNGILIFYGCSWTLQSTCGKLNKDNKEIKSRVCFSLKAGMDTCSYLAYRKSYQILGYQHRIKILFTNF